MDLKFANDVKRGRNGRWTDTKIARPQSFFFFFFKAESIAYFSDVGKLDRKNSMLLYDSVNTI